MAAETSIGERLKKRRLEIGMSLRKLAELTGVTASFLSQVEHAKVNVSLNSLQSISEALEVPLLYFLPDNGGQRSEENTQESDNSEQHNSDKVKYSPVVHVNERPQLFLPLSGVTYEMLVPSFGNKMVSICGRLAPGTGNVARKLREPTEEFIFVISGSLLVGLTGGDFILQPGETIYFKGEELTRLVCQSEEEDVVWISVITPPVF
jgi:transcriptional regulator with XRE-family HTH domain